MNVLAQQNEAAPPAQRPLVDADMIAVEDPLRLGVEELQLGQQRAQPLRSPPVQPHDQMENNEE